MIVRIQKTLSPNDMGDTGSHQAGIHVPKVLVNFFPKLDESKPNPRTTLQLESEQGVRGECRYIHYNNKLVSNGTRDEYRITRIRSFLRDCGASSGDTIEFSRLDDSHYLVNVESNDAGQETNTVVVDLVRGWRTLRS